MKLSQSIKNEFSNKNSLYVFLTPLLAYGGIKQNSCTNLYLIRFIRYITFFLWGLQIHCFFLGLRPNPVSHPKQLANLTDCKHLDNKFFSMLHLHYSVHPPLITSRALHLIRSVREKIFSSCIRNVYNRYLRCFAYYVKPYQNKNI